MQKKGALIVAALNKTRLNRGNSTNLDHVMPQMLQLDQMGATDRTSRVAAAALTVASLAALVFIVHHPSVQGERPAAHEVFAQLVLFTRADQWVHGGLTVTLFIFAAVLSVFHRQLRPEGIAAFALPAYLTGCAALIAAALVDGFWTPPFAAAFVEGGQSQIDVALVVLTSFGILVQILSKFGVLMLCVGIGLWSVALVRMRVVWAGIIAAVAFALPLGLIFSPGLVLRPHHLTLVILCEAGWNLAVAALLWQRHQSGLALIAAGNTDGPNPSS